MKEKPLHLEALNLDIFIPESVYFSDDGFVSNMQDHLEFLDVWYGRKSQSNQTLHPDIHGLMATFASPRGDLFKFHIFYLENSGVYTRAHEETHFLHAVKRLPALSNAIRLLAGLDLDINLLKNDISDLETRREVIAELGAIFATHQTEGWIEVFKHRYRLKPTSRYFDKAFEIYNNAFNLVKGNRRNKGYK